MLSSLPPSFLAPAPLLVVAALAALSPGRRPGGLPLLAERAALAALALAAFGVARFVSAGPAEASMLEGAARLSLRLDAVSAAMTLLVAFIGWIVIRYARSYLDGEAQEGAFHGLMLATLAAVLVLVQAGSFGALILAFVAVGAGLRRLLLFRAHRPEAQRAAAKFTLVWRAGDASLALAAILFFIAFGETDLAALARAAAGGLPIAGHLAVAMLALAAALKTAAFPLHGWLTEVMEAPTPVSALLHAGVINAGGVLLIRTADIVQASPGVMAGLVMLGGLTALFGSLVMLTQSAVKTALAWSTVAQMGFMLLQCGLGLWTLALLHIVAHSLYKAHAFLSSGGAVRAVAATRRPGPVAVPSLGAVAKSFALAVLLYGAVAGAFIAVAGPKSPQALALGAMLVFGVAYLVAQGLADAAPKALTRRTARASLAAAAAYFALQLVAEAIWGPHLPAAPAPGQLQWALIVVAVASFGAVAVAQALFPLWAHHPATASLRVHLANGLYLNALLDRLIGGYRAARNP
ncbi:proton-conducting transporter membrane subunit [Rubrimonas cliftonensis]|uniref:Probable inorganic carbon transporter subunit DabB n=1 Tax=Rubrimonas cliftonensis TaxID=89524 RepID=A0A1H3WU37_9RHOB|nr:proton-conducting transporter membrane subunit [Rubrimonas cliftonensis]SDZ90643.1 NADH-quinone oxidoreductase subunit L/NAD(P)H-quinone oxidoreductase subunit 5 [Rubrimonas cliftonensis]